MEIRQHTMHDSGTLAILPDNLSLHASHGVLLEVEIFVEGNGKERYINASILCFLARIPGTSTHSVHAIRQHSRILILKVFCVRRSRYLRRKRIL